MITTHRKKPWYRRFEQKISLQNKVVTTKPTQKLNSNQNPRSKYAPARHDHQTKSHATKDGAQQFANCVLVQGLRQQEQEESGGGISTLQSDSFLA
jgi:hypothetical protein